MIEVAGVTKYYGPNRALDNISFRVEPGEILGFLGPNGAGKTTTMKILTGIMPATAGTVKVAGYDVFEQPNEVKRRIGYMPEIPPLYNELTVDSYLKFMAGLKIARRMERETEIERVAQLCGVEDVRGRIIARLSKGYRQRVGLAQALLGDPPVLILDEPTIGLDPGQIAEVRRRIKDLAGKHTVILSTHILPEVTMICDRVVIISGGRIVLEESLDKLLASGGRNLEEVYLQVVAGEEAIAG